MSSKDIEDIYLLSPTQQGMLFHTLYAPDSPVYFTQTSWTIHADLDAAALQAAGQAVMDRHPILRSACLWEGRPKPLQFVRRHVKLPFEQLDWRGLSPVEQEERIESFLIEDQQRGFQLSQAPLLRHTLIRLSDQDYKFIWSNHHLLLDGWSQFAVLKELLMEYEAIRNGVPVKIETPRPYRDYISWLRQQDISQAESYWREYLKGFRVPTPLGVIPKQTNDGETKEAKDSFGKGQLLIEAETTGRLRTLARQQQLTLNTLVQGAWALLLSRYSGQPDVLFGSVVSGRPASLSGVEEMVGLFINTLPVRVQVEDEARADAWLRGLQEQQAQMRQYEYTPLVEVQRWSEVEHGTPLFENYVVF